MSSSRKRSPINVTKVIVEAIKALEVDEFTIEELLSKIRVTYPDLKRSSAYCVMSKLRKSGVIVSLPLEKGIVTYRRIGTETNDTKSATEITNTVARQPLSPKLSAILQVARAIIEYPHENFTKKDILKSLRSNEETVNANDATVFKYIGGVLINRNIVEVVGRSKGAHGVMVYKKGIGVVNVTEFNPVAITAILENSNSESTPVTKGTVRQIIKFEDLDCTVAQVGESIYALINKLEQDLITSIQDRANLINSQAKMQGVIDSQLATIARLQEENSEKDEVRISIVTKYGQEKDDLIRRLLECQKEMETIKNDMNSLKEEINNNKDKRVVLKSLEALGKYLNKE